jgi:hypothetical protein
MKKLYFFFLMGFMLINSNLHAQNTWYVNDNSLTGDVYTTATGNDGTNLVNDPSRPSLTLGDAFTAAAVGDIIYVDTGTYVGGANINLALNKAITIIGAGTGKTIIQGSGNNRFAIVTANNVIIQNLQFFSLLYTNGSGSGQVIRLDPGFSGFQLNNIVMSRNAGAATVGGSVFLDTSSSAAFNGLFFSCSGGNASNGGAIKVNSATLNISNSVFSNSRDAGGNGGAIEILGASNVTINNCNFDGNSAQAGGAIGQSGGTLVVTNSCFNRNYVQSGDLSEGGGHYFATSTIVSASFTNCRFEGAFFCATTNPVGYLCQSSASSSGDGNAISLQNVRGTFTFDTCLFNNSNQPNANFDNGLDIHLDKASSGTINVTVINCSFANDMFDGVGTGGDDAVNIWNANLLSTELRVTNSGTRQTTANQDGITGNNFSYGPSTAPAPNGNQLTQTSPLTLICLGQITGCSISVNCNTETLAPIITKCVDNKTITDCSGTLPNYTAEVAAFDDCNFTITQFPAPGTSLASLGNGPHIITITVSDESLNSPDATCTFTITLSGCAITCSDTTTWNGTWSNGAPTETKSAIFTTNYTAVADVFACSVTISDNAVVTIPSGFDCTVSRDITVNTGSSFVFENTANLLQLNATATNTGNIRMTRNTNPLIRLDYTLWSAPVTGQNLLAFSPLTLANRFYTYNTNTNFYITVPPDATSFTPGRGYQIRTPNNHPTTATVWSGTFDGVPNNGNITTTLVNFGIGQRFNMVGNPYPSPLNLTDFVAANAANITGTLYFWRKTNSTLTVNVWSTWVGGTFTAADEIGVSNPNNLARNGQGFFVEAENASTALVFNNSMRRLDNANQFFRSALTNSTENTNTVVPNAKHRIWLNLTDNTGFWYQQAISYIVGGTAQVDQFDGKNLSIGGMLFNSIIPNSTDYYVIQSRPVPFDTEDSIALNLKITNPGTYSISVSNKDGLFADGSQPIFLTDNFSTTCVNLNEGAYSFTAEAGTFDNRFELRYTNNLLSNPDNMLTPNSVMVYQNNTNQLIVSSSKNPLEKIAIYDTTGRLLFSQDSINNNAFSTTLDSFANVLLLVQITDSSGLVITKKIIKQ